MNPVVVFVLFTLLYQENNNFPNHFETFKLERLLDKLNSTVSSLDRINHLNDLAHEPLVRGNITRTIEDSIHTAKPLFPEGKPQQHLDTIESVIESFKKIGNLQKMAQNIGPVLNILNNLPTDALPSGNNEDPYAFEQMKDKEDPYL
ncbi:hypothetical protein [Aminipila sp.]|uniref:hypothetical protein n=1 Tax=Aminipila sp. TaxID=2060095 RepID=UPI001D586D33|nr:hypothetical protein [Aminipila sp.]MBE6034841.1 hypothetical protein [Clostridiales bacterium]